MTSHDHETWASVAILICILGFIAFMWVVK
jgi:hypothetical protein